MSNKLKYHLTDDEIISVQFNLIFLLIEQYLILLWYLQYNRTWMQG